VAYWLSSVRCLTAVVAAGLSSLVLAPSAIARATQALVVLPPGEGSTITLGAYAQNQASGNCADLGPHVCDQLSMYENWRFRDGALAPAPRDVVGATSSESPEAGVQIVRDSYGVPHIYASGPDEDVIEQRIAYGIGYAQAEERLFQMEVLRRAAEGDLAQLLGRPYLQMDVITRRDSETEPEREAQIAALSPANRAALESYAAGINAVIARDTQNPSEMPAGFQLLQDLPIRPWTASDTVAIISLEVANIAESAGNGLGYGALAQRLAARYGLRRAVAILDNLQFTHDPQAPVTVPSHQRARFTTAGRHYRFISYTRADTARLVRGLGSDVYAADQAMLSGDQAVKQATVTLGLPVFGSNAWALAPSRTTTGGALLWGGPQVGYYAPEVFDELEVEGGQFHLRGVGVPGGGPGIVIGYTPHTAWSITTAQDDQVGTYVDRIRPDGSGGYQYFWRGAWRPVAQRTEAFQVRQESPSLPITGTVPVPTYTTYTTTDYWTFHGPAAHPIPCTVEYLDAKAGLAYCKVRTFWNQELRTGLALVAADKATNLRQFRAAVHANVAGFNFIYADDRGNIAYWHTGKIPLWPRGADPRLPLPGSGRYDWRGYLPPSDWPSVIDPAQGFIASWNNKPQATWDDSGDGTVWGAYQRSRQLMRTLRGHSRFNLSTLWHMARRVGELDLRATLGFKRFLTELPRHFHLTPIERAAVTQVAHWDGIAFYPAGAQPLRGGGYDVASPGFAILDAWFRALENLVAERVFGPVVGASRPAAGVQGFTRTPQTTSPEYEFFSDYDEFVYNVMTGYAHGARYLDGRSPLAVSRQALDQAIAALRAKQGPHPAAWRAPMPMINFMALDVSGVPPIPWENRGTWGEALELPAAP
jgi:penicillin amidase